MVALLSLSLSLPISLSVLGFGLALNHAEREAERRRWEEARKYQGYLEQQLEDEDRRKMQAYEEVRRFLVSRDGPSRRRGNSGSSGKWGGT
jgi:hypothetical protein